MWGESATGCRPDPLGCQRPDAPIESGEISTRCGADRVVARNERMRGPATYGLCTGDAMWHQVEAAIVEQLLECCDWVSGRWR